MTTVIIPVKPFGVAKERLSGVMDRPTRARLGKAVAAHTIRQARAVTPAVVVVTPDAGVAAWADDQGCQVITEPAGGGLDAAASWAVEHQDGPWLVLHADLPLLAPAEVRLLLDGVASGWCLAPAHDGGTSAVGGRGHFEFSYGPGSFSRHLSRTVPPVSIVSQVGLAIDLDDADDLEVILRHPAGSWMGRYLG